MDIWWIPDGCKILFDDSRYLQPRINVFVGEGRRHPSFIRNRKFLLASARFGITHCEADEGQCERCGEIDSLAAHHIKPLWACVTESVCDSLVEKGRLFSVMYDDLDAECEKWNCLENLKMVCDPCHKQSHREENWRWRQTIGKKYFPHLCYNYGEAQRMFKRHFLIKGGI